VRLAVRASKEYAVEAISLNKSRVGGAFLAKKIFSIVLVLSVVGMVLGGCGKKEEEAPPAGGGTTAAGGTTS
jgi:hypothetical protein